MLRFLFMLGVSEDLPKSFRAKAILTNQITALLGGLTTLYGLLSFFFFPQSLWVYLIGMGVIMLNFRIHSLQVFGTSRFITAVYPTIVGGYTYLAASQGNQDTLLGMALLIFSLLLVPFVLFDPHEKKLLYTSFACCATLIVNYRTFNNWVDIPIHASLFHGQVVNYVTLLIAVLCVFACMRVLMNTYQRTQNWNKKVIARMEETHQDLEEAHQVLEATLAAMQQDKLIAQRARVIQEDLYLDRIREKQQQYLYHLREPEANRKQCENANQTNLL